MDQSPSGSDVADLVARSRSGDHDAYDRLFAHAADRALLFIRLRLGRGLREKMDSMDVLQDAYLEAWKAFDAFEPHGDDAFSRWLCRIIENKIRGLSDHFGAKKRRAPGPVAHVSEVLDRAGLSQTGPLSGAVRSERSERLAAALSKIEGEEREALLLRHFQERTVDEIAALLGRSATATRRLLGRATANVGKLLGEPDE